MRKLLLIGGGGHCQSVLDCLDRSRYEEILISDRPERLGQQVSGIPIAATDDMWPRLKENGFTEAFLTLGGVKASPLREKLTQKLRECGFTLITIIAPEAIVSSRAKIGQGVFIGKGTIVNTGARVGDGSILNTGAIIEHDVKIGKFCHIAPGSILCGEVRVGDNSHIGAGATILQGRKLGNLVTIGAGSVVVKNMEDGVTAYGIPCKAVKQ